MITLITQSVIQNARTCAVRMLEAASRKGQAVG